MHHEDVYSYISKINGTHRLLDRMICTTSIKSQAQYVMIDKDHRNSDHHCFTSSWKLELLKNTNDHFKEKTGFSVYRTMKNKKAIRSYIEKTHKQCNHLQKQNLRPHQLLHQTIRYLEDNAGKCFPKARSLKMQETAQHINVVGYNQFCRPLKNLLHYAYAEWRRYRSSQYEGEKYQFARSRYTKQLKWLRLKQV